MEGLVISTVSNKEVYCQLSTSLNMERETRSTSYEVFQQISSMQSVPVTNVSITMTHNNTTPLQVIVTELSITSLTHSTSPYTTPTEATVLRFTADIRCSCIGTAHRQRHRQHWEVLGEVQRVENSSKSSDILWTRLQYRLQHDTVILRDTLM